MKTPQPYVPEEYLDNEEVITGYLKEAAKWGPSYLVEAEEVAKRAREKHGLPKQDPKKWRWEVAIKD
jgi:DNA-binding phage protein